MSDLLSAISYDIEMYEQRCRKFREKVHYRKTSQGCEIPDCYGKHSEKLKKMDDRKYKGEK